MQWYCCSACCCSSSSTSSTTHIQTLFTFFLRTLRRERTCLQSNRLFIHLLRQLLISCFRLLLRLFQTTTFTTSEFTDILIPYSHSSVSLLQLSFMQIPRRKSYRLKHIQFKSALWTHSVRLQRTNISGLSLAQAGSASWRVLTAQSSSGHTHTVIPVTVLHTHLSVRLPVTPPFGECCLLRFVSENGVRKRFLSA